MSSDYVSAIATPRCSASNNINNNNFFQQSAFTGAKIKHTKQKEQETNRNNKTFLRNQNAVRSTKVRKGSPIKVYFKQGLKGDFFSLVCSQGPGRLSFN